MECVRPGGLHPIAGEGSPGEGTRDCSSGPPLLPPPSLLLSPQTTDGFSGLNGGWDTPGSGHNFLVHNMCRLPGADGTWMVVEGGMGVVTQRLAAAAMRAGAKIHTGQAVSR